MIENVEYYRRHLINRRRKIEEIEEESEIDQPKEKSIQAEEIQENTRSSELSFPSLEEHLVKFEKLGIPNLMLAEKPKIDFNLNSNIAKPLPTSLPAEIPLFGIEPQPLIDLRVSRQISEKFETAMLVLHIPGFFPLTQPSLELNVAGEPPTKFEPEKIAIEAVPGQYLKASEATVRAEEYTLQQLGDFIDKITFGLAEARGTNRPILIIAEKPSQGNYIYYITLICRELYRILSKRGKPRPMWLNLQAHKRKLESRGTYNINYELGLRYNEEAEIYMRSENKVYVLENIKLSTIGGQFYDRLRELYSQNLGFTILYTQDNIQDWLSNLVANRVTYITPKIICTKPINLPPKAALMLASLAWGSAPKEIIKWLKANIDYTITEEENKLSIDRVIGSAEKLFYEKLEQAYNNTELKLLMKFEENEGFEHRALKMKIVEIIARKLGAKNTAEIVKLLEKEKGCIKTEHPILPENNQQSNQKSSKADVYLQAAKCKGIREDVYIEIETLYGTGDPVEKIRQTLDKYLENEHSHVKGKIAIVTIGLHTILLLKQLITLKKHYTKHGLDVEFYTVNLAENKLVSLRDILKLLLQIKKEVNKMQFNFVKHLIV